MSGTLHSERASNEYIYTHVMDSVNSYTYFVNFVCVNETVFDLFIVHKIFSPVHTRDHGSTRRDCLVKAAGR